MSVKFRWDFAADESAEVEGESVAPQLLQNFLPSTTWAPQPGQLKARRAPHSSREIIRNGAELRAYVERQLLADLTRMHNGRGRP